jgi:hypothetical protein
MLRCPVPDLPLDEPLTLEQARAQADSMLRDAPPAKTRSLPTLPEHPWIQPLRRKLVGYWDGESHVRTVWQAATKLGTQPGGIGLFSAPPAVGVSCEWWQVTPRASDMRWQRPRRVHIDRIDDVIQRVFTSLV